MGGLSRICLIWREEGKKGKGGGQTKSGRSEASIKFLLFFRGKEKKNRGVNQRLRGGKGKKKSAARSATWIVMVFLGKREEKKGGKKHLA